MHPQTRDPLQTAHLALVPMLTTFDPPCLPASLLSSSSTLYPRPTTFAPHISTLHPAATPDTAARQPSICDP
eukprot:2319651-Rhodomonas_salina.1